MRHSTNGSTSRRAREKSSGSEKTRVDSRCLPAGPDRPRHRNSEKLFVGREVQYRETDLRARMRRHTDSVREGRIEPPPSANEGRLATTVTEECVEFENNSQTRPKDSRRPILRRLKELKPRRPLARKPPSVNDTFALIGIAEWPHEVLASINHAHIDGPARGLTVRQQREARGPPSLPGPNPRLGIGSTSRP